MEQNFRAFRIWADKDGTRSQFERLTLDDLSPGEVVVRAAYSSINYKDALAATGRGRILRTSPLVGGIDVAGKVVSSTAADFVPGDAVVVCGAGLSEVRDGGYSEYVRVPADTLVKLPPSLSLRQSMAIGTAGFTAAQAVVYMEQNRQRPEMGPIVVTGATGGVGSVAIDILSGRGYEVCALTGKPESDSYLRALGANDILDRRTLDMGKKPLERARWGGAIDNVGGDTLGWLTRTTRPSGNIASVGLAGGIALETTVMPFILRGVSLLGINSVELSPEMRASIWQRLGSDLRPRHLDAIANREIAFDDLPDAFDAYMDGSVVGRTIVGIDVSIEASAGESP